MSPRARFSDNGAELLAPVAAHGLNTGSAPVRFQPANDTAPGGRLDLLVRRRRRQARVALRA